MVLLMLIKIMPHNYQNHESEKEDQEDQEDHQNEYKLKIEIMALLKGKNAKDWKTTTIAIISGLVMLAGIFWPDKVDPETGETINLAVQQIVTGIGSLVLVITGIFGSKDGDKT